MPARPPRHEEFVRWIAPPYSMINTDGAAKGNPGLARVGCVIRDHHGSGLCGVAQNLGISTSILADFWGAYQELILAWERGYKDVILEMESQVVVNLLTKEGEHNGTKR